MIKQRRIRFNPNSIYSSQTKEELSLVGLSPHIEDVESGEGLHLQSPEAYYLWIEEMHERALENGEEIYWDES
jgi:hypothetical protein